MNTISKKIEELKKEVAAIFSQTEQNIQDANKRLDKLITAMAERGTDSLEIVKANTEDQLEHDQVAEFMYRQTEKMKQLKEENSKGIYSKIETLKNSLLQKEEAEKMKKAEQKVLNHWEAIKSIDKELEADLRQQRNAFASEVSQFIPYMLDGEKHKVETHIAGGYWYNYSFADKLKDGRLH